MKELKKNFTKLGDDFTQVYRENGIAIYRRSNEHYDDLFEVFKIQVGHMHPMDKNYDPSVMVEKYPCDEVFGSTAWCCHGNVQLYVCLMEKLGIDKKQAFTFVKSINK